MKLVRFFLFGILISSFSAIAATSSQGVYESQVDNNLTDDEVLQQEINLSLEEENFLDNNVSEEAKLLVNARRRFICISRNIIGRRFSAEARNRHRARRISLRRCRNNSRFFIAPTCQLRRCRMVRTRSGRF